MPAITRQSLMRLGAIRQGSQRIPQPTSWGTRRPGRCIWALMSRLQFEDEMTMRYQIQEMLRAERIFEEAGIQEELNAYNPLIPDGGNWKATMMIEYGELEERRVALSPHDRHRRPRLGPGGRLSEGVRHR